MAQSNPNPKYSKPQIQPSIVAYNSSEPVDWLPFFFPPYNCLEILYVTSQNHDSTYHTQDHANENKHGTKLVFIMFMTQNITSFPILGQKQNSRLDGLGQVRRDEENPRQIQNRSREREHPPHSLEQNMWIWEWVEWGMAPPYIWSTMALGTSHWVVPWLPRWESELGQTMVALLLGPELGCLVSAIKFGNLSQFG